MCIYKLNILPTLLLGAKLKKGRRPTTAPLKETETDCYYTVTLTHTNEHREIAQKY